MKIYFRLPKSLIFSKDTVKTIREIGCIPTRRDTFKSNSIIINHGNSNPITLKGENIYLINRPTYINLSSNKLKTKELLSKYQPREININEIERFPVVIKLPFGCQGKGVFLVDSINALRNILSAHKSVVIEEYKEPLHEYRFNVLDGKIYQISRKDMVTGWDSKKFKFQWVSLGANAGLHKNTFKFVNSIINDIVKSTNYGLSSFAVDIIKSIDKKRYLTEINSAFGISNYTAVRLINTLLDKYENGELEKYRVR